MKAEVEEALNAIKSLANALYEQGTVSLSPKQHEVLRGAIQTVERELQGSHNIEQEIASDIEKV